MKQQISSRRILLLGFEKAVYAKLAEILARQSHSVWPQPGGAGRRSLQTSLQLIEESAADVVCCPADTAHYPLLVNEVKKRELRVPVVVVSDSPNLSEWLDAIQAGAWDYFGAPFEAAHIRHVIDNAVQCATPVHSH